MVKSARKIKPGRAKRRPVTKKVVVRVEKRVQTRKRSVVARVPRSVPGLSKGLSDRGFVEWLTAAKRDPWNVKPPALGIHSEPTMVVQYRWKEALALPNSTFRCTIRPYNMNLFGYSVAADVNGSAVTWRANPTNATVANMFLEGRPLAGGIKLIPLYPSTSAPGIFASAQQPTTASGGWQNVGSDTFSASGGLLTAMQDSPVAAVNGVPLVQLWHEEDMEDTQMDSTLVSSVATPTTNTKPQSVATIALAPANSVVYVDVIFWMECALRDDTSALFGGNSKYNVAKDPTLLMKAEEKASDATPLMSRFASAASGMADACLQSPACSAIAANGIRYISGNRYQ